MNIIILSDIHFYKNPAKSYIDPKTGLSSWFLQQCKTIKNIFDYGITQKVDAIIINGDLFEEKNKIDQSIYNTVFILFQQYADKFILILNIGNHDILKSLNDSSLKPFSSICEIIDIPKWINLYENYKILILPFGSIEEKYLRITKKPDKKYILFTHDMIEGLVWNGSKNNKDKNIPLKLFKSWDIVFNGHIHKPQSIKNIINIGSPIQQNFNEADEEKRFIHLTDEGIKSIKTESLRFFKYDYLNDNLEIKIQNDEKNFYHLTLPASYREKEIFEKYNVFGTFLSEHKKETRFKTNVTTIKEDIHSYVEITDTELDKQLLKKIGVKLSC